MKSMSMRLGENVMNIIDARVRLPSDLRPKLDDHSFYRHYNAIFNMSDGRLDSLDGLLRSMDDANIYHAIVHAEYEYGNIAEELNEGLASLISKYPLQFSGFGAISFEPLKPMRALGQLEKMKSYNFIGVNLQPTFFGLAIDDRRLYPIYAKAVELGLIVSFHTGVNYSLEHPIRNGTPILVDQVACDFPELTIIACHSGWPWVVEMVAVARKHPNVYLDFGGIAPKYIGSAGTGWEVMRNLMNNLLSDQILFATDWPVIDMSRAVQEWKEMGLKEEVLQKLFFKNAQKLISNKGGITGGTGISND